MKKSLKLFIALHLSITATMIGSLYDMEIIGNSISLLLIILAFLAYGKCSIIPLTLFIITVAFILYLIEPGSLMLGVSLLPFVGLFFMPAINKSPIKKKYIKTVKIISILNIFLIHIIGFIGYNFFESGFINYQSQLYLYIIIVNILIFKEPFVISVVLSVLLPVFFSPGHIGNRSAIFLLLFLFNKSYMKEFFFFLKKKRLLFVNFIKATVICCLTLLIIQWIINHPKFSNDYQEERFIWFAAMLEFIMDNGIQDFMHRGTDVLTGTINPHNSFFWLILNEAWVGVLKILLFIASIFVIPFSAWLAIFGRANLDSFFFSAQLGIIFCSMIRTFFQNKFKRRFVFVRRPPKGPQEKSNIRTECPVLE